LQLGHPGRRRSISRVLSRSWVAPKAVAIIPLRTAIARRLKRPTRRLGRATLNPDRRVSLRPGMPAYVALLPMGFALPPALPRARWALTPPFHPYRRVVEASGGGFFSVALSSALPLPGVTRHRALRSSDFPSDAYGTPDDRCRVDLRVLRGGGKSELRRAVCRITSGTAGANQPDGQCNRKQTASGCWTASVSARSMHAACGKGETAG